MKSLSCSALLILLLSVSYQIPASSEPQSPEQVSGATTIDAQQAKQLFDNEALFVDVRKDSDWNAGRIPGAIHIELKKRFDEAALNQQIDKHQPVVIYCNGPKCMRSSKASKQAIAWGFKKVYYFRDGFPAWKQASFPIE